MESRSVNILLKQRKRNNLPLPPSIQNFIQYCRKQKAVKQKEREMERGKQKKKNSDKKK